MSVLLLNIFWNIISWNRKMKSIQSSGIIINIIFAFNIFFNNLIIFFFYTCV